MKIFILGLLLLQVQHTWAQQQAVLPVDDITKLITYTNKIDMPDKDKGKLYDKALEWCNAYYKNPTDVIREKDAASGVIICKARFKIYKPVAKKGDPQTDAGMVQYTLKIEMKEGRYRYILSDINWKQVSYYPVERWMDKAAPGYSEAYDNYLEQVNLECKKIVAALVTAMSTDNPAKRDDW